MKELRDIISCCNSLPAGERAALATIVRTSGSTYRKPGARMLICESGRTIGSVSGGCLDRDVCARALRTMKSGSPVVVRYDDGAEDPLFGMGLGCGGAVEVLIELVCREADSSAVGFLGEFIRLREASVLATVITAEFGSAAPVGARMGLRGGHIHFLERSDGLGDEMRGWLETEMVLAAEQRRSRVASHRFLNGFVEAFVEFVSPPVSLAIFGAGVDAVPLTQLAKQLGWSCVVIDHRPAYADPARLPAADAVFCARPDAVHELIPTVDAAVVMTHNYLADLALLRELLPMQLRYLAVLGPWARTEMLARDAREHGFASAGEIRGSLHGPAGLDIGAETPEEIAVSIIAEIKAALTGRTGGMLRHRMGAIHHRSAEPALEPISLGADIWLPVDREPELAIV